MAKIFVFILALPPAIFVWLIAGAWLCDHTGWPNVICFLLPAGAITWIFSEAFK